MERLFVEAFPHQIHEIPNTAPNSSIRDLRCVLTPPELAGIYTEAYLAAHRLLCTNTRAGYYR